MRRGAVLTATASLMLALAGCKGMSVDTGGGSSSGGTTGTGAPAVPAASHSGTLATLVEPDNGVGEIYKLINGARSSINLTMYELKDATAENDLVSSDYAGTRDFAELDTDKADVRAITKTFDADFSGKQVTPPVGDDLVWSPTNSRSTLLDVINGARHTLSVENEEMNYSVITSALISAAKRGVDVKVIMTADSEWDDAFSRLERAGVHVRTFPDSSEAMYIHAKAVVADAGRGDQNLFVGSENFSKASLDYNRELGIRTSNPDVVSTISKTLASDYRDASGHTSGGSSSIGSSSSGSSGDHAPTRSPAPERSTAATASGPRCGAPPNPYGLTLCSSGQTVTSPPSGVCEYFKCISSFDEGKGYMVECEDGSYSMSGGHEESCTDHGGPGRAVRKT